ncbi:hypothetical protein Cs7R123_37040 [Catellatospora sp. TT07R-123]|uniref:DUF3263 domain-containing protein n=1 Tax=Catellatospora sp. TT07R-123 TaxID=2733863 RepID=UPI001B276A97|nr:DUF3263 domain-containing protein [Catellatospora sp. TT07R-123]GHJ46362.1 hypothetical protein Cs7R123_37040 [Catellatospora sp. TT07R-123]
MEQIRQRSRTDGAALEELPLLPETTRREPAPHDVAPSVELDDEIDSDRPAGVAAVVVPEEGLTERERGILDFERQWWRHAGAKEQAIRDRFELSSTRYYQVLNALLDNPAALEHDPVLVGRLRRLRGSRTRAR